MRLLLCRALGRIAHGIQRLRLRLAEGAVDGPFDSGISLEIDDATEGLDERN